MKPDVVRSTPLQLNDVPDLVSGREEVWAVTSMQICSVLWQNDAGTRRVRRKQARDRECAVSRGLEPAQLRERRAQQTLDPLQPTGQPRRSKKTA
jgi:hypothetical protein